MTAAPDLPSAPAPEPSRGSRLALVGVVAAVWLAADLWSKAWAWNVLRPRRFRDGIELIPDWAYLEFGFNTGAAFSLFRDVALARGMFIVVTIGALLYMLRLATTLPTRHASPYWAIGMIMSGALGNLHDRVLRTMEIGGQVRHGVVDFIKVYYWPGKPWPTFNVADVALVVGVGLLLIYITRHGEALDGAAPRTSADAEPTGA
jgi:signal peptidase II